jgi:hypothetical protein
MPRLKRLKVAELAEVKVSKLRRFPELKTVEDKVVLGALMLPPLMETD